MFKKTDQHILITIMIFMSILQLSLCLQQVEVFKLFAYDNGDKIIGSKVSSFSLVASHYSLDVFRKIALIHFNELSIDNLVQTLLKRPFGLLIILPKNGYAQNELELMQNLISVIKGKYSKLAVYFVWEEKIISSIYTLQEQKLLQFSVKTNEPQLIKNLQLEDFYGYMQEIKTQNQLPTILIIASYDSFIPSAELKLGFHGYKSGAFALLNLMKFLKDQQNFYSNLEYNVMFYLTSTKHNDISTTFNWFNRLENQKYTGSIQYSIYLDSISQSNNFYLKYNKGYEIPENILEKILKTAKNYNITVELQEQETYESLFQQLRLKNKCYGYFK